MEENVSPELSVAHEPEKSQDHTDSCSQGNGEERPGEQKPTFPTQSEKVAEEAIEKADKASKADSESKKTWAFRRSTVAQREMPVEAAPDNPESRYPVRRSGRQSKRTDKLEEFLSTTKRVLRKSAPPTLESGDPPSQTPTDAETASEASFDGNADTKTVEDKPEPSERRTRSSTREQTRRATQRGRWLRQTESAAAKDDGSSENEDSGDGAEPQDKGAEKSGKGAVVSKGEEGHAVKEHRQPESELEDKKPNVKAGAQEENSNDEETARDPGLLVKRGPIRTYINKKRAANVNSGPGKASTPVQAIGEPRDEEDSDEDDGASSSSSSSESDGGYDPNALYCICRQKHNKRFMICCDRCEEWFHGDCVGITEARGRLMERNGEDYVCPNCTTKKSLVIRPATSMLSLSIDTAKAKTDAGTEPPPSAGGAIADLGPAASLAAPAQLPPTSTSTDEKGAEDIGIKGRIEKATNPTGKKKIKIFQPTIQQAAPPNKDQKGAPVTEKPACPTAEMEQEKVASNVEVKTTDVEEAGKSPEDVSLPKCIGPGCESSAQPDSVYCGNDCILRHAAATMKSFTEVKEPKSKAQKPSSASKTGAASRTRARRDSREDSESDRGDDDCDPDEDDEDAHAVEQPPPPATASWCSDHNYIAVPPEKTTPISTTVLNKKCMYLFEGLLVKIVRFSRSHFFHASIT